MKQCERESCEGCASYCDKSDSPFSYKSHLKGDRVIFNNPKSNVILLISGELSINIGDTEEYVCKSGQMVLLNEKERYIVEAKKDSEIVFQTFLRSYQVCGKISLGDIKIAMADYKYQFHSLAMNKQMRELAKSIAAYLRDGISCMYIHQSKLWEMFVITQFYYKSIDIFSFFYPVIDKDAVFQSVVRTYISKANSVEQLADLCGYNINTFKKLFRESFHESPYKWMLQQKAHSIKAQLTEKVIPIKAIVAEFGFTDQSHLNVFCKKYLGGTSVQIREGLK